MSRAPDLDRGAPPPATSGAADPTAGRAAVAAEWASESAAAVADPAPLGLAAFALTTFLLSLINAGLISEGTEPVVIAIALTYGGLAQLLAGMWEFRKGNTFGATAFTSYGAFWLSFWAFLTFYAEEVPAEDVGTAVGWYLMVWGVFTTIMLVAALRTTVVLVVLFALLAITFFVLGTGDLLGAEAVVTIGGYFGLVTAAVAWYACLAGVAASTFGRPVLPNQPLGRD